MSFSFFLFSLSLSLSPLQNTQKQNALYLVVLPRLEFAATPRQQQPPDLQKPLGQRLEPRPRGPLRLVDGREGGGREPLGGQQAAPLHAVEGEGEPEGHVDGEVGREGPEGALGFLFLLGFLFSREKKRRSERESWIKSKREREREKTQFPSSFSIPHRDASDESSRGRREREVGHDRHGGVLGHEGHLFVVGGGCGKGKKRGKRGNDGGRG